MRIFSLIQARGGSKGVPGKNIKLLGGYPLIAYSIAASKLSSGIQRTIFSTESTEIAEVARRYGAEVLFMRPVEFAQDHSGDLEVLNHAIEWLEKNEGSMPDLLVQLRPTTPLRNPILIEEAISKIKNNHEAHSLRSAHQVGQPPQKMFQLGQAGFWAGFFPDDPRPEYYNLPRQSFPDAYCPNGHVDIVKPELIKNKTSQPFGSKILSFITPFLPDIDRLEDFEHAEFILNKYSSPLLEYLNKFPKEK